MSPRLMTAVSCIMCALIFYTVGVWMEHIRKKLQGKHVVLFIVGLIFDSTGTFLMSTLTGSADSGTLVSLHTVTGYIAILLMFVHAVWAVVTLVSQNEKRKTTFHKFSIFVWGVWLVPFVIGMIMGMR